MLLGPDYDDAAALQDEVLEAEDWPLFVVPLAPKGQVYIVYRTFEGDAAIDILPLGLSGDRAGVRLTTECLAVAHFTWADLVASASDGLPGGSTDDPHQRLLLLMPLLGFDDITAGAETLLAEALATCTAVEEPTRLAELLIADRRV